MTRGRNDLEKSTKIDSTRLDLVTTTGFSQSKVSRLDILVSHIQVTWLKSQVEVKSIPVD